MWRRVPVLAGVAAAIGMISGVGGFAERAWGASHARVVRAGESGGASGVQSVAVDRHRPDHARVVYRPVVSPDAVVSRALSEQPIYEHLAEVVVVHTRIYVDPHRDYERRGQVGGLDRGHFIVRAQRAFLSRQAEGARVIYNEAAGDAEPSGRGVLLRIPRPEPEPVHRDWVQRTSAGQARGG